jgi:cation diffusion facilitator family transporter
MDIEEIGNRANKFAILVNVILTILNFVVGIISGSTALVAQAADNAGDLLSNLIGLWAFRIGLKPADAEHPYGHGRIEPLVGLLISIILFFIAYQIFQEAYAKFLMIGSLAAPSWIAAGMAIVAFFMNYFVMKYLFKTGKEINSQILMATGNQKKMDVFTSVAIFFGIVGSQLGYPILDPILAVVIGCLVIKTAFDVARENIDNLMGKVPSKKLINDIKSVAVSVDGVYDAHDIKVNNIGPYASAEFHVKVKSDLPLKEAHKIAHNVEKTIIKKIDIINTVTVHVCPLDEDEKDENCYD